jgi:hypothetical protein
MGIKLDWEFESEHDWEEVGEDPSLLDLRKRRGRQLWNLAIVVLALGGAVFGVVRYRLHSINRQLRADLESTIASETLALRIGDQQAFLDAQSEVGAWDAVQENTFDTYQVLGERLVPTGEVVDLDMDGDQARVVLREQLDGQVYHVTWFYQHGEEGWLHVAPAADLWGAANRLETEHFTFIYYDADSALVDVLASRLDGWWEAACQVTGCQEGLPHIEVRVEPDPLVRLGWADYDGSTLVVPSPLLGRVPEDNPYDPQLEGDLAALLTWRWVEYLVGGPVEAYSELDWVSVELQTWLRHTLDGSKPPSAFLGPMAAAYGSGFVPGFVERVRRGEPAVPVLAAMTGTPASDLPVSWDTYFTYRLRGEAQLIADGYETEAALIYGDPGREVGGEAVRVASYSLVQEARPDSIRVVGTQQDGEVVWAEVVFEAEEASLVGYVPFRLVGDRWVRAALYDTDWGGEQEERSQHFVLHYRRLDAEAVHFLLPHLEQIYGQVAADFALPTDQSQLVISVQPNPVEPRVTQDFMSVPSPYNAARPVDQTPQDYIRSTASTLLVESLVTEQLTGLPDDHPLIGGFVMWESDRLKIDSGLPFGTYQVQLAQETGEGVPESLAQIWENDWQGYVYTVGAAALIDVLTEIYGPEVIPTLLANLENAESMDDWLSESVGITSADIEAEWQVRLTEWLNRS